MSIHCSRLTRIRWHSQSNQRTLHYIRNKLSRHFCMLLNSRSTQNHNYTMRDCQNNYSYILNNR
ncbi:MAG: hypothetical protein IJC31_05970 [Spirochaetaceae bacterium]|nr:hypothetical protein [Spirochaetaceae bacterium]